MFVIGITGPSGAGKGALSAILSSFGMCVIDADKVYHEIITPPSECLTELVREFGNEILKSDGTLDRRILASLVFGEENRERLMLLNSVTHRYVVKRIKDIMEHYRSRGEDFCVIDAPLLIESGLCCYCNLSISVLADKSIRQQRISTRDCITQEVAEIRINSQKSDEFYISNTDCVVYNNTDLNNMRENVISILRERKCGVV